MHIVRNGVSVRVFILQLQMNYFGFCPGSTLLLFILQPVVVSVPISTVTKDYPSDSALLIAMH